MDDQNQDDAGTLAPRPIVPMPLAAALDALSVGKPLPIELGGTGSGSQAAVQEAVRVIAGSHLCAFVLDTSQADLAAGATIELDKSLAIDTFVEAVIAGVPMLAAIVMRNGGPDGVGQVTVPVSIPKGAVAYFKFHPGG